MNSDLLFKIIKDKLEKFKFDMTFELDNKPFDKEIMREIVNLKTDNITRYALLSVNQKFSFYIRDNDEAQLFSQFVERVTTLSLDVIEYNNAIQRTAAEPLSLKDLEVHFRVYAMNIKSHDGDSKDQIMPFFYYLLVAVPWTYNEFMELINYMDEKNHLPYFIDKDAWFLSDGTYSRDLVLQIAKINKQNEIGLKLWLEMQ